MTDAERREAARQFYQKWFNKGKEDQDDRSYWIDFLQDVMGVDHVTDRIEFQKKVIGPDGNTKKIDAYIPETRVLIEQKSLNIDLSKPQSGHNGMTPYEQAKMYDNSLIVDEKARWIILSNFAEIWIYDMNTPRPEDSVIKIRLEDIQTKYDLFEFLVNKKQRKISQEMEISVKAGEFVGLIYDALLKQYLNPESEESLKSLNMLCVRLVFCLYAEDAHIFGDNGHMFHDYLDSFKTEDLRRALIDLFKILDTPEDKRDPYDDSALSKFPYVNGGLFADENIEIPKFTEEIRTILLTKASDCFDWSKISPTIFGAVFESTLNPETRRSGGMHYTSIENIHKVIDPLFLDDLKAEYEEINAINVVRTKKAKLEAFQDKLASLKWLDPACGSGNFLTETYISIRRLENKVIQGIVTCEKGQLEGQMILGDVVNPIKVKIDQFYGIEINDFAVTVAKTALWIAESQMLKETEDIILQTIDFLPLTTNAYIVEGNALKIDWNNVVPKEKLSYIMGNPPFVGAKYLSKNQKNEIMTLFDDSSRSGLLDYVSGWYKKATMFIQNSTICCAFVSTNSISQGEQVAILWDSLKKHTINIDFCYTTFKWDSEADSKAAVHVIIIGFSSDSFINNKDKKIYSNNTIFTVNNINGYLLNGPNVYAERRNKPICNVLECVKGNQPTDGGNLIIEAEDYNDFLTKEPSAQKWIKKLIGSDEFINNKPRYCLWLVNATPNELRSMPLVMERVLKCKEARLKKNPKLAEVPHLFRETRNPKTQIVIPVVSSEKRRYIPMGFIDDSIIAKNQLICIPNANMFYFGILESNVHMAWMRTVCGRLEMRYCYSKEIVYNNFPWPTPTSEQKEKIEKTAQGILDARALYPDSSLADLYDPLTMPSELLKAHQANDRAVMEAYGFNIKETSEADCVAALMKMYQDLTNK